MIAIGISQAIIDKFLSNPKEVEPLINDENSIAKDKLTELQKKYLSLGASLKTQLRIELKKKKEENEKVGMKNIPTDDIVYSALYGAYGLSLTQYELRNFSFAKN
jgi:hypothetical protein